MFKTGLSRRFVNTDANAVLDAISSCASEVIELWRQAKATPLVTPVCKSTVRRYRYIAQMLEEKFSTEACVELNTFSPVEIVQKLFDHSANLAKSSWTSYRSAMVYHLHECVTKFENRKSPQEDYRSYRQALAALIVIQRSPRRSLTPAVKRGTNLPNSRFQRLIKSLDRPRASAARDFAIATMLTGLRPCEWTEAVLRPAEQADMPLFEDPNEWSALTIHTGKRKGENTIEVRTLIFKRGSEHDAIARHIRTFATAKNKTATKGGRCLASKGHELMIKNCSELIKKESKKIWPNKPSCWVTLYTLRSQARANFAKLHGVEVGAAMLGHSVRVSQGWYAPKRSASLGDGAGQVVPGRDVILKAATSAPARSRPDFGYGLQTYEPAFIEVDDDLDEECSMYRP